jgi:hypothetical protein
MTAGKLTGEIAGAQRFCQRHEPRPQRQHRTDPGQLAQHQQPPPRPWRQLPINTATRRVAITRARCHAETARYLERKRAKAKTNREHRAASNATSAPRLPPPDAPPAPVR